MTEKVRRAVVFGLTEEWQLPAGALHVVPGDEKAELTVEEAQVVVLRDIAYQLKKLHEKLDNVADAVSAAARRD